MTVHVNANAARLAIRPLICGANWGEVAGSAQTNQMKMPVNATSGAVFFRLESP